MTDYFDWLTAGDFGLAVDRLADSFKLTHQELRRTAEALSPVYAMALRRVITDPDAWTEVTRRFLPFLTPVDGSVARTEPAANLSCTLFGSKALTEQIARQVSLSTAIAPDTLERLMDELSVITLRTMIQMMLANLARHQPRGLAEGNYPAAMAEMMRRSANAIDAMARPSDADENKTSRADGDYLSRLFADALMGPLPILPPGTGAKTSGSPRQTESSDLFEPFEAMLEGFRRGLFEDQAKDASSPDGKKAGVAGKASDPSPEPVERARQTSKAQPSARPADTETVEPFDELARAGQSVQEEYVRQMNALFALYQSRPKTDRQP